MRANGPFAFALAALDRPCSSYKLAIWVQSYGPARHLDAEGPQSLWQQGAHRQTTMFSERFGADVLWRQTGAPNTNRLVTPDMETLLADSPNNISSSSPRSMQFLADDEPDDVEDEEQPLLTAALP